MKDDFKKQKWNVAAGANAVSYLEMLLREQFDEKMESLISLHPILKMYFDSDLSSEIENNAFIAISDAIFTTVDAFTNKGAFVHYNVIGMTIANIICKRLYLLKLIYHANSGRITKQQFCELAAKNLAVETAALLNIAWDFLGQKLPTLLNGITKSLSGFLAAQCNVDPATVILVADTISGVFSKLHPKLKKYITPEKIEELLKTVIDYTLTAAKQVTAYAEKVVKKCKSWGRSICRTLRWAVPDFLKEEDHPLNEAKDSKSNLSATINHIESKEPTKKTNPMASKNPFEKNNPAESKDPFRKVDQSKGSQTTIIVEK